MDTSYSFPSPHEIFRDFNIVELKVFNLTKGIMLTLQEMKKRGSGLVVVFVDNGTISEVHTTFSDEHPEDLALTKNAVRAVFKLGVPEVVYKQELREKREVK